MAQGGAFAVFGGNPFGGIVTGLLGLFQALSSERALIDRLVNRVRFYQTAFSGMKRRGLFASQTQRRLVRSREIWEEIGYAQPNEIPPLLDSVPAGTTMAVRDTDERLWSREWSMNRGFRDRWAGIRSNLRWAGGQWWGTRFQIPAGSPPDFIPPVGRDGVHRVDFPAAAIARASETQERIFLGPRPLAGEENAMKRAAFQDGGGRVWQLWVQDLEEQSKREGRTVRAWTGRGWLTFNPNREVFDDPSPAYTGFHSGIPDDPLRIDLLLRGGIDVLALIGGPRRRRERDTRAFLGSLFDQLGLRSQFGLLRLSSEQARALSERGFFSRADLDREVPPVSQVMQRGFDAAGFRVERT